MSPNARRLAQVKLLLARAEIARLNAEIEIIRCKMALVERALGRKLQ